MHRPINSPFVADMPDDYARREESFPYHVAPQDGGLGAILGLCAFAVFIGVLFIVSL